MSSHREAPGTSQDPVADNTDTYAFVSPDKPNTVTLIANFLPFEAPFGGPNFFEFADDVEYYIYVDNDGDGYPDVTYTFNFTTVIGDPDTFLYNTGQITSISSPNWNRKQFYSVTRSTQWGSEVIADNVPCPPSNIGPASTPNYAALAAQAVHSIGWERTVFAGQRLDPFYIDLGAIFDLGDLRPFENLHIYGMAKSVGVNSTNGFSLQSIALQVPFEDVAGGHHWGDWRHQDSVIGVWAAASRSKATIREPGGVSQGFGPQVQVSRLANPLFNEVIVPLGKKDLWNSLYPAQDNQFLSYVQHPELAGLLPTLYPNVFPNLKALDASGKPRADLVAILLTGLPAGIVPGFQNYTGSTYADELRLNLAIPPTTNNPNPLGIIGGDLAGFPNGRRPFDDTTSVELRAIAGATYPLVAPHYKPDAAASLLTDGLTEADTTYLSTFPYLGTPQSGYQTAPLSIVGAS